MKTRFACVVSFGVSMVACYQPGEGVDEASTGEAEQTLTAPTSTVSPTSTVNATAPDGMITTMQRAIPFPECEGALRMRLIETKDGRKTALGVYSAQLVVGDVVAFMTRDARPANSAATAVHQQFINGLAYGVDVTTIDASGAYLAGFGIHRRTEWRMDQVDESRAPAVWYYREKLWFSVQECVAADSTARAVTRGDAIRSLGCVPEAAKYATSDARWYDWAASADGKTDWGGSTTYDFGADHAANFCVQSAHGRLDLYGHHASHIAVR